MAIVWRRLGDILSIIWRDSARWTPFGDEKQYYLRGSPGKCSFILLFALLLLFINEFVICKLPKMSADDFQDFEDDVQLDTLELDGFEFDNVSRKYIYS